MKRPLISIRSSQQQTRPRFVSSWAQICSKSEEISVNRSIECVSLITPPLPRLRQPRFILAILAIGLAIATIFDAVFAIKSRESVGFNNAFNVLNNDFKLELEYDLRDVLSSPPNDTICAPADTPIPAFCLHPTSIGLAEFGDLEYIFDVVFDENEFSNEINNVVECEFDENFNDNEYYYATPGMFIFFIFCFLFACTVQAHSCTCCKCYLMILAYYLCIFDFCFVVYFMFVLFFIFYVFLWCSWTRRRRRSRTNTYVSLFWIFLSLHVMSFVFRVLYRNAECSFAVVLFPQR